MIWARESAGFIKEEIVHKLRIKLQKLEDWEKGETHPTMKQLRKLGQIYKRPIAVFYLSKKPIDFKPLHDFRRIPGVIGFQQPVRLNFEIRRAIYRRQVAINLVEKLYGKSPKFKYKINVTENPEEIGGKVREILKINIKEQIEAVNDYEAFNMWRSAIENTEVLIFQSTSVSVSEMRGFSISEFPLPVICLNIKDTPRGRIFTLLHEFAHIMLEQSGICDLHESYKRSPNEQKFEVFCNHVSGATLLPKQTLLNEDMCIKKTDKNDWTNDELIFLAKRFKISKEVVLRRLLICGLTTESFYRKKRQEFLIG